MKPYNTVDTLMQSLTIGATPNCHAMISLMLNVSYYDLDLAKRLEKAFVEEARHYDLDVMDDEMYSFVFEWLAKELPKVVIEKSNRGRPLTIDRL